MHNGQWLSIDLECHLPTLFQRLLNDIHQFSPEIGHFEVKSDQFITKRAILTPKLPFFLNINFLCKQYIYKVITLIGARQRVVPGQPLSLKKGTLLSLSRTVKNDKTSILDAMKVLSKTTFPQFKAVSINDLFI